MALRAVGADARDDGERDILGGDAGAGLAVDGDAHALRLFLPQRLRHQNVRHLGGADAEGVGAERAVGRGVAVAAHDRKPRQRQPLLRPDHMNDALARIVEAEQYDAVRRRVGLERAHHRRDFGIGDRPVAAARRHIVIGDAEGELRLGDVAPARAHLAEGMERAFMHVMAIDPEERGAVLARHDRVRRPQFVDQGLRCVHCRADVPWVPPLVESGLVELGANIVR